MWIPACDGRSADGAWFTRLTCSLGTLTTNQLVEQSVAARTRQANAPRRLARLTVRERRRLPLPNGRLVECSGAIGLRPHVRGGTVTRPSNAEPLVMGELRVRRGTALARRAAVAVGSVRPCRLHRRRRPPRATRCASPTTSRRASASCPSGEPVVVAMKTRQLRQFGDGTAELYADMSGAATSECNDMLVDPQGRAYVSTFGYDLRAGEEAKPGTVDPRPTRRGSRRRRRRPDVPERHRAQRRSQRP